MHAHPLLTLAVALVSVHAASAQVPELAPAPAPPAAGPLLTEAPIESAPAPRPIPTSPDPSLTALETAVLAAHNQLLRAIEARDLEQTAALHVSTNRGAMVFDGRLLLTKDDVLDLRRREYEELRQMRFDYQQRHVSLLSSTSAVLVGEGSVTAVLADGTELHRAFAHSIVFLHTADGWKVAHWHASTPRPALLGR